MGRDTQTGKVLEGMVIPMLEYHKYRYQQQVPVGVRPSGKRHVVDLVVTNKDGQDVLVSLKWQQVPGTAEQKVPFEVICLLEALEGGGFSKAYLVLGGEGWTLRDYFTSGKLEKYFRMEGAVVIQTFEAFIAKVNRGEL